LDKKSKLLKLVVEIIEKVLQKWNRLKDKHKDKSKEWWWDTQGIDLDLL
jgi:hypothetical protein